MQYNINQFSCPPAQLRGIGLLAGRREGWVCYGHTTADGRAIPVAEWLMGAKPLTKAEFDRLYPNLPPLPKTAFE